jgi:hypothetical protein
VIAVTVEATSLVSRLSMMRQSGDGPSERHAPGRRGPVSSVGFLVAAENLVFSFVGVLFFIAAFALALRATVDLWALIAGPHDAIMSAGTAFLDIMLLVLMMVELAYTVTVSLRGSVLAAEPFLIVGLIAVIRRILVITIGDVSPSAASSVAPGNAGSQPVELGILTGVVLVLVGSIVLLRLRPRLRSEHETAHGVDG